MKVSCLRFRQPRDRRVCRQAESRAAAGGGDGDDEHVPYVVNNQQLIIADWHNEMSDYLKDQLPIPQAYLLFQ